MCSIGIGGGVPDAFEGRSRVRKLEKPRPVRVCDHNEADNDLPFEESLGKKDFVSDAPFDGPSTGAAIGIGGGPRGFFGGRGNLRPLRASGADSALDRGLRWLKAHQREDGSWEGRRGVTGLVLLAYLGAGQTHKHGFYRKTMKKGLRHLKSIQAEDGGFEDRSKEGWPTEHAILTLAMVEAYGVTGSPLFKSPAQSGIDHLSRTKAENVVVTEWAARVYRAAEAAGLTPPEAWKKTSLAALTPAPSENPPGLGAAEVFARVMAGVVPSERPQIQAWARRCTIPNWSYGPSRAHFTSLALFQVGGDGWEALGQPLLEAVVEAQVKRPAEFAGSWPPSEHLGRIATTAIACLTLEAPVLYARINRSR